MSPQEARIILVDDSDIIREAVTGFLKAGGQHQVVLEAASVDEVEKIIEQGLLEENKVDIGVVDFNLQRVEKKALRWQKC